MLLYRIFNESVILRHIVRKIYVKQCRNAGSGYLGNEKSLLDSLKYGLISQNWKNGGYYYLCLLSSKFNVFMKEFKIRNNNERKYENVDSKTYNVRKYGECARSV